MGTLLIFQGILMYSYNVLGFLILILGDCEPGSRRILIMFPQN